VAGWRTPENLRRDPPPPDAAYGVPTGPINGFFAVDLDTKDTQDGPAELSAFAAKHGELRTTRTVRTPSGGLHLYFAWDPARPVRNRQGILPGVDVRGEGGFVVAGGPYTVVLDGPVAAAPPWLLEFVAASADAGHGVSAVAIDETHEEWAYRLKLAKEFLEKEPPCISGQGGQGQLWAVALRMSRTYELPIEKSIELLAAYNARCDPPWSEAELRRHLTRAAEKGHGPTGTAPEGWAGPQAPNAFPAVTPDPTPESWRRRHDSAHRYSFNSARAVHGGTGKESKPTDKELAAVFMGDGAVAEWRGVWQSDIFSELPIAVDPPMRLDAETSGLSKADIIEIKLWLACEKNLNVSVERVQRAVEAAANACRFHPVLSYLDALPTMSIDEAKAYFQGSAGRLWGAEGEDDKAESEMLMRQCIAAVRRIRHPGTKVDEMLILHGEQGSNKSRFLATLFGEHFADGLPDDWSKRDAAHALRGKWGIEISELASWGRTEEPARKAFLSRTEDRYREYGVGTEIRRLRQCVFFGTTNDDAFLRDPTGARRYNIVHVVKPIDLEGFERDDLWAAAVALEAAGERHFSDRAESEAMNDRRSAHGSHDPWDDAIDKYLRDLQAKGVQHVSPGDALTHGIQVPIDRQTERDFHRVRNILRRKCGQAVPRKPDGHGGKSVRMYRIPPAEEAPAELSGVRIGIASEPSEFWAGDPNSELPPARSARRA
jgi:putative DNA primase/helicase